MITRDRICCCAVSISEFDGIGGSGIGGTCCWDGFLFELVSFRVLVVVVSLKKRKYYQAFTQF